MKIYTSVVFLLPALVQVESSVRGVRRRKLQLQLVGFGGEPDASRFPLQLCQGDCDNNEECDEGLICFQRDPPPPGEPWPEVPGCIGGAEFAAQTDFCILGPVENAEGSPTETPTKPPTRAPTESPSDEPTTSPTEGMQTTGPTTAKPSMAPTSASYWDLPELDYVGDAGNLGGMPLGVCQGDCDNDDECLDELICFQRSFKEPVPGCRGEGRPSMDYCIVPPTEEPEPVVTPAVTMVPTAAETMAATEFIVALQTVGDANFGTPLGLCQGDCDTDDDCLDDLVCFQRTFLEPVPGCAGTGSASYDYCILDPDATDSPTEAVTSAPTEFPLVVEAFGPPTTQPTVAPSMRPLLTIVDMGKNTLLGLCEGKCKDDDDCEGDLICMNRDSDDEVPGCGGTPHKGDDYCINP